MERLNKPRVFLSHSFKDKKFVNKVFGDLMRCKTAPWLDEFEIRVGKPFMKVIFEEGIATCDIILVYITENSIKSRFVEKEIDAALIQELEHNSINMLLYLEKEELRSKLRLDLKTLQSMVWNNKNYLTVLPQVVSEIWLSFIEKSYDTALLPIQKEKLELELELEKIKTDISSPFTKAEIAEFEYLYFLFNKNFIIEVDLGEDHSTLIPYTMQTDTFELNIIDLLIVLLKEGFRRNDGISISNALHFSVNMILYDRLYNELTTSLKKNKLRIETILMKNYPYLELKASKLINIEKEIIIFLDKVFRFYHWLSYKGLVKEKLIFNKISEKKYKHSNK